MAWCGMPPVTQLSSMMSVAPRNPPRDRHTPIPRPQSPTGSLPWSAPANSAAVYLTVCRSMRAAATLPSRRAFGPPGNRQVERVDHEGQRLELDLDQLDRGRRDLLALRADGQDRLADEMRLVGQDRSCGGGIGRDVLRRSGCRRRPASPARPTCRDCDAGMRHRARQQSLVNSMPSARKSSAYLASPVTFACDSAGGREVFADQIVCHLTPPRRASRRSGIGVGAAAAQVAGHRLPRLFAGRLRGSRRASPPPTSPGPACRSRIGPQLVDERLLHRVQRAVRPREAFDRGHLAGTHGVGQRRAGVDVARRRSGRCRRRIRRGRSPSLVPVRPSL